MEYIHLAREFIAAYTLHIYIHSRFKLKSQKKNTVIYVVLYCEFHMVRTSSF